MTGSVNKAILIGNLCRDPEMRSTQNGGQDRQPDRRDERELDGQGVCGERKEKSEFHRIVIFNDRVAEFTDKYARKGSKVYVEGQLQTRKWTDQSGQDKYTTEVVIGAYNGNLILLADGNGGGQREDTGARGGGGQQRSGGGAQQGGRRQQSWDAPEGGDLDDQIPF